MILPFGKYKDELIHISEVQSGRTDLTCPNCGQPLIAKKGKLKEHHFAHDGASCTANFSKELFGLSTRLPTKLPLCVYAQRKKENIEKKLLDWQQEQSNTQQQEALVEELLFRLHKLQSYFQQQNNSVQTSVVEAIIQQTKNYINRKIAPFPSFHLLRDEVFKKGYTDGKQLISPTALDTNLHEYYYPLVFQPYIDNLQQYSSPTKMGQHQEQIDLYQKELVRFHQFQLYFLEIQIPSATIHKIGLTTRPIAIRLKEIQQDLKGYFHAINCNVLILKKGVAFLEHFFKRKYAPYQFSIGTLTEYFQFPATLLEWLLKDLECINQKEMPARNSPLWVFWAYFHSNGKLYGGKNKYLFIKDRQFLLTTSEQEEIVSLNK